MAISGSCSWKLDVQAGMGTPFVGEALHMLGGAGGGKGRGAWLYAMSQGQGPSAGLPHAATFGCRIQRRLRILNSNLLFQVIVKIYLSE